ncbi:YopX family protein [Bacillus amyloliquefaciens]|uniref:YopX family protein n=1 Tax=Bacillus amyloliquefaciens group TaxID=1938374 RepID=UPI0013750833|nr:MULTISPECIES: YopX family protein [Bacillus amyloliquefaciens group]UQN24940.1 YopX family protein [Bacillus velezensis]WED87448.1 YopX family protein [Bacillus velezensis]WFB54374.1 YopX family protein [Bacillus velezensis]WJM62557.1 YopX family protein [Bacillus amyloliquefaciens]
MREVKFRGMGINGEWYCGNLSIIKQRIKSMGIDPGSYISNKAGVPFAYSVRQETVGQFTGLKDKNGREIYEGDIVRNHRDNSNELLEVLWQEEVAEHASDGIYWTKEVPGFRFKRIKRGLTTVFVAHVDLEVIDNIHQNPELLEASHASK